MRQFYQKYKEQIRYLFFGICTTLVNWVVHFLIITLFPAVGESPTLNTGATVIAWICAVLFAFFTYKKWVFEDTAWDWRSVLGQFAKFVASRLVTLGTDALLAYLLTQPLHDWAWLKTLPIVGQKEWLPMLVLKVLQAAINMVVNYLLSKFLVFRKTQENAEKTEETEQRG